MDKKNMNIGIFLVHSLHKSGIGGMETHQKAFISNYVLGSKNKKTLFYYIIENEGNNIVFYDFRTKSLPKIKLFSNLGELINFLRTNIFFTHLFLNDGWWIESISSFKTAFPLCHIYMRSGGNDAELAPWNYGTYTYEKRRTLWMESINKLDFVIANSDFSVTRLISLGINQQQIKKIRGGVNEIICCECRNNKNKLRYELINKIGINQKYILIFASRFVPFKGIIPALECIKQSQNIDNCHIIFVGSGKLLDTIKKWCIKYLKDNQFTFMGEKSNEDTIRLIAASDILVNPSINLKKDSGDGCYIHTETMGRSMMEAITVNTKIIATDAGGTNELFKENQGIGYLSSIDETSMIKAFNMIDVIINEQTNFICDYSWNCVFNLYDIMFSSNE